jgi:predicted O-methyltransferase YrrM
MPNTQYCVLVVHHALLQHIQYDHVVMCIALHATRAIDAYALGMRMQVDTKPTIAIRELNDLLVKDERITLSILPVGDGMALCRKR